MTPRFATEAVAWGGHNGHAMADLAFVTPALLEWARTSMRLDLETAARKADVWRTDRDGTIHVELAGRPARWPGRGYRISAAP